MSEKTIIKHKSDIKQKAPSEKKPCLNVLEGLYVGEVFALDQPTMVLGRDRTCQITIMEDGVSRQHAQFQAGPDQVTVMDLGSTNGTYVNGTPLKATYALKDGDKIQIGDVLLRFSYQDAIDISHHETMREMAMKDPLTQIYNRRYFMDLFQREISYANRMGQPLTCILFDLDHFKQVNDTYGHQAGDHILRTVAQYISKELRIYDAFARYGGEEFVIMLRTTTLENALKLAERLRKGIEELDIVFEDQNIPVTISMGLAALDLKQMMTHDQLLQLADEKLYQAKEQGRNCIVS